jgi:hypothetical protein
MQILSSAIFSLLRGELQSDELVTSHHSHFTGVKTATCPLIPPGMVVSIYPPYMYMH